MASFSDWSKYVRGALIWLGCTDPCGSMEQARDDDPELSELRELLMAWREEIGDTPSLATVEIIEMCGEKRGLEEDGSSQFKHPLMRDIVTRIAAGRIGIDSRRLGNILAAKSGRIVQGLRIEKATTLGRSGAVRWRLRVV